MYPCFVIRNALIFFTKENIKRIQMGNCLCPEIQEPILTTPLLGAKEKENEEKESEREKEKENKSKGPAKPEWYKSIDSNDPLPLCEKCKMKKHKQVILSKDPAVVSMKVYLCLNCKPSVR